MTKELELAKYYFELSNESNFDKIEKLFTDSSTYSSESTGLYLGVSDIINMQKSFHNDFKELKWTINNVDEQKPGIILFGFEFYGLKNSGEKVEIYGDENIIVYNGKIQHIEIGNIKNINPIIDMKSYREAGKALEALCNRSSGRKCD